MNPSHYPDIERCNKLTELGFPKCEKHWLGTLEGNTPRIEFSFIESKGGKPYVCPSVMEMMDAIPQHAWEDFLEQGDFDKETLPRELADHIVWMVEKTGFTFDKR